MIGMLIDYRELLIIKLYSFIQASFKEIGMIKKLNLVISMLMNYLQFLINKFFSKVFFLV